MRRSTKLLLAGAAVVSVAAGGTGVAFAASGGEDGTEVPITGEALDRASAAALQHTGGGQVTETEAGDEDSFYEVEVTLDDGTQIDVQLDEGFNVVGDEPDDDSGHDDEGHDRD